jgi:hypothetical protein
VTGATGTAGATGPTGSTTTFLFVAPTADPHVVNAVWNNAGVLTVSAG